MGYDVTVFTPARAVAGGALIGLASVALLLVAGRVAGISGIAAGLLGGKGGEIAWRAAFVAGLLLSAWLVPMLTGEPLVIRPQVGPAWMALGGFLVGFGTRLGSGCTAGHGISGLARLSRRSLVATLTFFVAAMLSVHAVRHAWEL